MAESKQAEPDSNPDPEETKETEGVGGADSLPVSPVDDGVWFSEKEKPGESPTEPDSLLAYASDTVFVKGGGESPHPRNRRRHGARKWIKRSLIGIPIVLLSLILIVGGVVYFAGDWAVEKAWPMVDSRLSKKGIYLSWDSVDQIEGRGVVLENVVLFKDSSRAEPLLTIGNVAAAFKWGHEKLGGGPGAKVTLDQSGVLLDTGSARNQLTGLQGSLTANTAGIAIDQLVGELNGLRLDVAGDLLWSRLPAKKEGKGSAEQPGERVVTEKKPERIDLTKMDFSSIDQALEWIRFSGEGAPILLEARFTGPEAHSLDIDLSLKGSSFTWRDVPIDVIDLGLKGEIAGEGKTPIEISPLQFGYRGGMLNGVATFEPGSQKIVVSSLNSNLDLAGLAAELHPPTREQLKVYQFRGAPEIAIEGTLSLKNLARSIVSAEVNLPQGLIADLNLVEPFVISAFQSKIAMKNGVVTAEQLSVEMPGGRIDAELKANPFAEPREFEGQFMMKDHAVDAVAKLFGVEETVDDVVSVAGTFSGNPSRIHVSSLKMDQNDRSIAGEAIIDLDAGVVEVKSLKSNFDLLGLASKIHPLTGTSLAPIHLPEPPEFDLSGTVSLAEVLNSTLKGSLVLPGGVVLGHDTLAPIEVAEFRTDFVLLNQEVVAEKFHLKIFGGAVDGVVTSNPFSKPPQFEGTVKASELSLAALSRIFAPAVVETDSGFEAADVGAGPDSAVAAVVEREPEPAAPAAEEKPGSKLAGAIGVVQDVAKSAAGKSAQLVGIGGAANAIPEEGVPKVSGGVSPVPDRINFSVELKGTPNLIEFSSLRIENGDRALAAQAVADLEKGIIKIDSLDSNLDLVGMAKLAHPPSRESLKSIEFGGGPAIQMSGTLPWKQPKEASLSGSVKIPEGLTVTPSEARQFHIDDFSSTLKLEAGTVTSDDLSVQALGGLTQARVIARPFEEKLPLGIAVQSKGLLLAEISRISGAGKVMPGTADFTLQGNGFATLTGFNGKGKIDVKDTEFYFIPVIGKLLDKLNSLNLGLKENEKSNLSANFAISEGVIDSPDLNIQLANLDVDAPGWVDLGKEYVDLDIRVRPGGLLGSANRLSGISLEVSAKGPYDQISYNFVGGAAETALGIVDSFTGGALGNLNGGGQPPTDPEGTMPPEVGPESGRPPPPPEEKKGILKKLNLFQKK